MKRIKPLFLIALFLALNFYSEKPIFSEPVSKELPFKSGEKFDYKVDYNRIYVGRIE